MEFDESKVCTQWSDELEGKKGWFSDFINGEGIYNLRHYIEHNNQDYYGVCSKGKTGAPFCLDDDLRWRYFYPYDEEEKETEFDKKNLFIAGYNDDEVNVGDEGIVAENIDFIKRNINNTEERTKIVDIKDSGFRDTKRDSWSFFYRTKCAPKKHYIPWTKENFPLYVLSLVRSKVDTDFTTFIGGLNLNKNRINVGSASDAGVTLEELFDYWELPDGTPCGQEEKND